MFRKLGTLSPHAAKFSLLSHANNICMTLIRCGDVHNYMHFTRLSVVTVQSTVKLRAWCVMYIGCMNVSHISE